MMKEISPAELQVNPWELIAKKWMLITAGTMETRFNTMTASWGELGSLWGHGGGLPVATIFVRPQRYTKKFIDENEYFSLSFYPEEDRKALGYLGSHSGKDEDKVAAVGFKPEGDERAVWFQDAELVLICRKLYQAPLLEKCFLDENIIKECYPDKDFHEMYIGEIEKILVRDNNGCDR